MRSVILQTATQILVSLMIVFSIFMLLRGHNAPGGGFVGGLIASTAFALYAMARGPAAARRALRKPPGLISFVGLSFAIGAAVLPLAFGKDVMTGLWAHLHIGATDLHLGSSLLFDTGVYLVVLGAVMSLVLGLEEETA